MRFLRRDPLSCGAGLAAVVASLALVSCTTGNVLLAKPSVAHIDGQRTDVDILVRGFLVRGDDHPKDYGYYADLLLADNSDSTKARRLAVAKAFMAITQNDPSLQKIPRGGAPWLTSKKMALLLAPTERAPSDASPEAFLKAYDYGVATMWHNALKKQGFALPPIAIVGSAVPLDSSINATAGLMKLDLRSDPSVETTFKSFEHKVVFNDDVVAKADFDILPKMKHLFDALGQFVTASSGGEVTASGCGSH